MTTKCTAPNLDHLYQRHLAGESIQTLAAELSIAEHSLYSRFNRAGYKLTRTLDLDSLYARYAAGESSETLAAEVGISGAALRHRFYGVGLTLRSGSEAQTLTANQRTPQQRSANTAAAHAAVLGMVRSQGDLVQRALTVEKRADQFSTPIERELASMLNGLDVTLQKAIGKYNVDLAIGDAITVEIFGGSWHNSGRHAARFQQRIHYLLDSGWHVIIVWIEHPNHPLTIASANYLVAFAQFASLNPTVPRQYRVMRGTGEVMIRGCAKDDHFPMKLPRISRQYIRCKHLNVPDEAVGML